MFTIRGLPLDTLTRLVMRPNQHLPRPVHVLLCIADHFEPLRGSPPTTLARERVDRWVREYPAQARRFADSSGRPPQHTFFYPAEEYRPDLIDSLSTICQLGLGDVEVHLHHDHDNAEGLRDTLLTFTRTLHCEHGLLEKDANGRITYGFIHGNWALDNSHPDGRWCGVNNELTILRQTGCYADFTMPSAPAACQTRTINSIYYAVDDPLRPKSHDQGIRARAGSLPADALLLIQGPLGLDWSRRRYGVFPALENGDLTGLRPPTLARLWLWLGAEVRVAGRNDWLFVKLHTHGAWEPNTAMLLGEPMAAFHTALRAFADENDWFRYYYVTAREMAHFVHTLEADQSLVSPDLPVAVF